MRLCNAESHKRSAKGSNFKEDDRAFPYIHHVVYGRSRERHVPDLDPLAVPDIHHHGLWQVKRKLDMFLTWTP